MDALLWACRSVVPEVGSLLRRKNIPPCLYYIVIFCPCVFPGVSSE